MFGIGIDNSSTGLDTDVVEKIRGCMVGWCRVNYFVYFVYFVHSVCFYEIHSLKSQAFIWIYPK